MAGETDGGDVMGALCFTRLQSNKSRKKKIHTNQGQIANVSVLRMIDIPKFQSNYCVRDHLQILLLIVKDFK